MGGMVICRRCSAIIGAYDGNPIFNSAKLINVRKMNYRPTGIYERNDQTLNLTHPIEIADQFYSELTRREQENNTHSNPQQHTNQQENQSASQSANPNSRQNIQLNAPPNTPHINNREMNNSNIHSNCCQYNPQSCSVLMDMHNVINTINSVIAYSGVIDDDAISDNFSSDLFYCSDDESLLSLDCVSSCEYSSYRETYTPLTRSMRKNLQK